MKRLTTYIGAVTIALLTSHVSATPLSVLFAGDTITQGDKLFADWEMINRVDPLAGDMDLALIEVTGIGDGTAGNEYGLQFTGNGQWSVGDDFLDLFFGFSVEVMDPTMQITGSTMTGTVATEGDEHLVVVEKDIFSAAGDHLSFMEIYSDPFDAPSLDLSDSAAFGGQSKIFVEDNIAVDGFGGSAELLAFTQRFVQREVGQVPAPATLALLGLGLAGLGWSRRKQKRS